MNILQVPRFHWNNSIGGVELYVKDLVECLRQRGVESTIVTYQRENNSIIDNDTRFPLFSLPMLKDSTQEIFIKNLENFLEQNEFTCAHFHLFRDEEALIASILKHSNMPYIFTYHLPAALCYRGNLMRWGKGICDSKAEAVKCTACRIQNRTKMPPFISSSLAYCMSGVSKYVHYDKKRFLKIDYWKTTSEYIEKMRNFLNGVSIGISCSQRGIKTLELNGVRKDRIRFIPQGLPLGFEENTIGLKSSLREKNVIGYVGRISPEKGVELLIDAFMEIRDDGICLELYGIKNNYEQSQFEKKMVDKVRVDKRIKILERLTHVQLQYVYKRIGFLAVPSICPETGPLVIWEALSYGVPIIASDRIGHLQLLENGKRGIIVAPHNTKNWIETLKRCLKNEYKFINTPMNIRSMRTVADEMLEIYSEFEK